MAEAEQTVAVSKPRRFFFGWVPRILVQPKKIFSLIGETSANTYITPLLVLTLTSAILVFAQGYVKSQLAATGEVTLPPGFEFYPPEQQAQLLQGLQATNSPAFLYIMPLIGALVSVWGGWLIVSGLLHFILTLLGGRGGISTAQSIAAWAAVPFALRDLVRAVYTFATRRLITAGGLAGFLQPGENLWLLYLQKFFSLIDAYLIWHLFLIVLGVITLTRLSKSKSILGSLLTVLLVLAVQALLIFGVAQISSLTITRPFFF